LTEPGGPWIASAFERQDKSRPRHDDLCRKPRRHRQGEEDHDNRATQRHTEGASGAPTGASATGAPTPIRTSPWQAAAPSAWAAVRVVAASMSSRASTRSTAEA